MEHFVLWLLSVSTCHLKVESLHGNKLLHSNKLHNIWNASSCQSTSWMFLYDTMWSLGKDPLILEVKITCSHWPLFLQTHTKTWCFEAMEVGVVNQCQAVVMRKWSENWPGFQAIFTLKINEYHKMVIACVKIGLPVLTGLKTSQGILLLKCENFIRYLGYTRF